MYTYIYIYTYILDTGTNDFTCAHTHTQILASEFVWSVSLLACRLVLAQRSNLAVNHQTTGRTFPKQCKGNAAEALLYS